MSRSRERLMTFSRFSFGKHDVGRFPWLEGWTEKQTDEWIDGCLVGWLVRWIPFLPRFGQTDDDNDDRDEKDFCHLISGHLDRMPQKGLLILKQDLELMVLDTTQPILTSMDLNCL